MAPLKMERLKALKQKPMQAEFTKTNQPMRKLPKRRLKVDLSTFRKNLLV